MSRVSMHVPFEQLLDLVDGRLGAQETHAVHAHLADCGQCAREASELAWLLDVMRTDDSTDAPPDVVERAIRLFRDRHSS